MLSHYKSVIWYTGDDLYVREPTQPGGTGNSKLMDDEVIAVRDYLNDGGTVLVTGQQALQGAWLQLLYNPLGAPPTPVLQVQPDRRARATWTTRSGQKTNCIIVSNDFMQYYLGAWIASSRRPTTTSRRCRSRAPAAPFGTTRVHAQRRRLGRQPGKRTTFVTTSSILPASQFPQFDVAPGDRLRPAAVLRPAGGHAVRLRRVQRRGLPAAAPHDRPDRRHHGGA